MASILTSPSGLKRIQFRLDGPKPRRTISIGHATKSHAQTVCNHIEHLIAHQLSRQPVPPATAAWLGEDANP